MAVREEASSATPLFDQEAFTAAVTPLPSLPSSSMIILQPSIPPYTSLAPAADGDRRCLDIIAVTSQASVPPSQYASLMAAPSRRQSQAGTPSAHSATQASVQHKQHSKHNH